MSDTWQMGVPKQKIAISPFVQRQTMESPFSYFDGDCNDEFVAALRKSAEFWRDKALAGGY